MISLDIAGFQTAKYGHGSRHFLCVHGWGGGHAAFEPLLPFLPNDVTLWCPDLPGYGESEKLATWQFATFEEYASRFLDAFEPTSFTLFGNCSGALFGMTMLLKDPNRCEQMFLIDPFAFFPWYFQLLTSRPFGEFFYRSAFANPFGRALTAAGITTRRPNVAHMTQSFESLDHEVVYAYLKMMREIPNHRFFADLEVPTTLLIGERTFGAVHESARMWHEIWPNCKTVELRAAHLPIQEATLQLSKAVFA